MNWLKTKLDPSQIPLRRLLRWGLVVLSIVAIGWLFWSARDALLPFQIGIVLAYLIFPLVSRLEHFMPRWVAILLVYVVGLQIFIGVVAYVVPLLVFQAEQLLQSLPDFDIQELQVEMNEVLGEYKRLVPTEVQDAVEEGLNTAYDTLKNNLLAYARDIGSLLFSSVLQVINTLVFLTGFIIVPIWMFYIISDYEKGCNTFDTMLPARIRADFWAFVKIINRVLSSYIRGQLILGVIIGSAAGIGLTILNLFGLTVKNVLLLSVVAGVTELIPYVGPILGAVPAIIVGFFHSPTTGIAVAILYLIIQILENNFLVPRIIGDSLDIHPAILIVLMIVFGQVFGLVGIILVAPCAAMARDVFLYVYSRLQDPPRPAGDLTGLTKEPSLLPFEEPPPSVSAEQS